MRAARLPKQRPPQARLMVIDADGRIRHAARTGFIDYLRAGDLVIANDAATLPASLHGRHAASGAAIEVRLAGQRSFSAQDFGQFSAILFGAGDYHTETEARPAPPVVAAGDRLLFGALAARVQGLLGHPRLLSLRFDGSAGEIWAGLAHQGRPIQYAHVAQALALWDVWTPIAGMPVAFEPPSAGFVLDWQQLAKMRERGVHFATITHAAGISSTGDRQLDQSLPFAEAYRIPRATAAAIRRARARGARVIAIGTTVVRALEHAAAPGRAGQVRAGDGVADQRIGSATRLHVVDAILSGTHEMGTSHFQLLRAFTDDATLAQANAELESDGYRTHEFGDSVLIERRRQLHAAAGWR
ncbi:S-adenosylmethionine:tRNA ribosyltransferase-isomerase [Undibacterium sp.]|jgi:S-adenosylmethionine:tRNA ribosyltransferase-isomerase|uniref:S-adenosylmethionine:tRNA ribosyltransferase-isomerase n=1 Tax=Undibacterium sp. TaxID=1914977 RepID=UPI002D01B735|nr:S-adenosylmethionine:tRNA ribosyltransferase-isomerase [Undibacterium sp.]HTD03606.1 S-adenosylmethionine:tRNA ribosyltransferase-isomerase [Undibacterium sp.]